jgi:hypothetical protein
MKHGGQRYPQGASEKGVGMAAVQCCRLMEALHRAAHENIVTCNPSEKRENWRA